MRTHIHHQLISSTHPPPNQTRPATHSIYNFSWPACLSLCRSSQPTLSLSFYPLRPSPSPFFLRISSPILSPHQVKTKTKNKTKHTQHSTATPTSASSPRAAGTGIGDLLLLVGSGPASDGGSGASRGRGGRGTAAGARAGCGGCGAYGGGCSGG